MPELEWSPSCLLKATTHISNGIISFVTIFLSVLLAWNLIDVNTSPTPPYNDDVEYTDVQKLILYYESAIGSVYSCSIFALVLIFQWIQPLCRETTADTTAQDKLLARLKNQIMAGKLLSAYLAWDILVALLIPPSLCGDACMSGVVSSIIMWAIPSSATTALMAVATGVTADTESRETSQVTSDGLVPVNWWTQWISKASSGKTAHVIYCGTILYQLVMAVLYGMHWLVMRAAEVDVAMELGYVAGFLVVLAVGLGVLGPSLTSFGILVVGQLVLTCVTWKVYSCMEAMVTDEDGDGNLNIDQDGHANRLHTTAIMNSVVLGAYVAGLGLQFLHQKNTGEEMQASELPTEKSRLV